MKRILLILDSHYRHTTKFLGRWLEMQTHMVVVGTHLKNIRTEDLL